jgi:hypothetical protein
MRFNFTFNFHLKENQTQKVHGSRIIALNIKAACGISV